MKLNSSIEIERKKLYECINECDNLLDSEVIRESENLDKLIVGHMKSKLQQTSFKKLAGTA